MYPIPPSEHLVENKICKQCQVTFPITDKDMEFYEKVSPVFPIPLQSEGVSRSDGVVVPLLIFYGFLYEKSLHFFISRRTRDEILYLLTIVDILVVCELLEELCRLKKWTKYLSSFR